MLWGAVIRDTVVRGEPMEEGSHRDMPPTPLCHWLFPLPWWRGGEGDESQKWALWRLTSRALGSWAKGPLKGGVKAGAWSLPLALGLAEGSFSEKHMA